MFNNSYNVLKEILQWNKPFFNISLFFIINVIFWWIGYFRWRFYGIIFAFSAFIIIFEKILEIFTDNYNVVPSTSTNNFIKELFTIFVNNICTFRNQHPNLFHIYTTGGSIALFTLGRNISGFVLTYFLIVFIYLISLLIKLFPKQVNEFNKTFQLNEELSEDDLIPVNLNDSEKDLDNESLDADSCTNSFVSGLSKMPSYLEIEGSLEKLDEDFEINPQNDNASSVQLSQELSDDSDSEIENEVNLDTTVEPALLLDDDESSSSEEKFSEGIEFSKTLVKEKRSVSRKAIKKSDNIEQVTNIEQSSNILHSIGTGIISNFNNMGSNLMSVVFKRDSNHSSSESDFEFIESEDISDDYEYS